MSTNRVVVDQRYYILMTEQFGRAVYAEKDLKKGDSVMYCETLPLSVADTITINNTDLKDYTFTFDAENERDCLVLGDGEMFNHDDKANVRYYLQSINGRFMMVFRTTRDVKKDAQLFIDYNADVKDSVIVGQDKYTTNLVA